MSESNEQPQIPQRSAPIESGLGTVEPVMSIDTESEYGNITRSGKPLGLKPQPKPKPKPRPTSKPDKPTPKPKPSIKPKPSSTDLETDTERPKLEKNTETQKHETDSSSSAPTLAPRQPISENVPVSSVDNPDEVEYMNVKRPDLVDDKPELQPRAPVNNNETVAVKDPTASEPEYGNIERNKPALAPRSAQPTQPTKTVPASTDAVYGNINREAEEKEINDTLETFQKDLHEIMQESESDGRRRSTLAGKVAANIKNNLAGNLASQPELANEESKSSNIKRGGSRFSLFRSKKRRQVINPKKRAAAPVTIASISEEERLNLMEKVRSGEMTVAQMDTRLNELAKQSSSTSEASGPSQESETAISPKELKMLLKLVRRGKMTEDELAETIANALTPTKTTTTIPPQNRPSPQPSIPTQGNQPKKPQLSQPSTSGDFYGKAAEGSSDDSSEPSSGPSQPAIDPTPVAPPPSTATTSIISDEIYDSAWDGPATASTKTSTLRAPPPKPQPFQSDTNSGLVYGDALGQPSSGQQDDIYQEVKDDFQRAGNAPPTSSNAPIPTLAPRIAKPTPEPTPIHQTSQEAPVQDDDEFYSALPPAQQDSYSSALSQLASVAAVSAQDKDTGEQAVLDMMNQLGLSHFSGALIDAGYDDLVFIAEDEPASLAVCGITDPQTQELIVARAQELIS